MSASLFVWLPAALLVVISLFCFVGCILDSGGLGGPPFTDYRGTTILPHLNLVAFWPLGEMAGETTAVDLKGGHNGTYTTVADPGYPTIPPPPGEAPSAKAPGTFTLGETGIVAGDTVGDAASRNTCMKTNGGYVSVPFDAAINPTAFTIEAWVSVEWTGTDEAAFRTVIDARAVDGGSRGFALYATPDNHWEVWLGNGGAGMAGRAIATTPDPFPMSLAGVTFYLAASYDGKTLTLFVDEKDPVAVPVSVYAPNDNVSPHVPSPLYIGAGAPWLLPTDPPTPIPPGGPRWPFRGRIQDVAVYNAALDPAVIAKHKRNGDGVDA